MLRICISHFHTFCFHLYFNGPFENIPERVILEDCPGPKTQITRGLTGRPSPTDPAPYFPELPHRISIMYSPSAFQRGARGVVCAIQRRMISKEKSRKYHPVARIRVGLPLLGVSATCCAQLAKHTSYEEQAVYK